MRDYTINNTAFARFVRIEANMKIGRKAIVFYKWMGHAFFIHCRVNTRKRLIYKALAMEAKKDAEAT